MLRIRYRRILWFFAKLILQLIWWDIFLSRLGLRGLSRQTRTARLRRIARSFRNMAVKMGGVMIKVGQFLSARLDVLPVEITSELAGLQDEVPPEPFAVVRRVVEAEFNASLESVFGQFDPAPLASASIGQVHRARLFDPPSDQPNGEPAQVVVKVQRPDIPEIVETDLSALRVVGRWIQRYPPIRKRANVPELLEEFSRSLHEEIDYLQEGQNAVTFAKNFQGYPGVCVPRVYWEQTTRRVLTLEDVWAIKISDYAAIEQAGVSRAEVARRLFDTYLKQIFEDHFFHADPHPGNLFIFPTGATREDGRPDWQLVFVDFGMVGRITPRLFSGLRELLIAVGTRDARRITRSYEILGILLPGANIELLERAGERIFERFWGKTTPEVMRMHNEEAMQFAEEFRDLLYELPFQVPENLILLGRCVGILSGMCTGMDPDFNVWTSLAPYAERLVESENGGRWQFLLDQVGRWVRILVSLPTRTEALLDRIEQGRLEVRTPDLDFHFRRPEVAVRRLTASILFAALLLGAVQLYLGRWVVLSEILAVGALITLVGAFWGR